MTQIKELIGAVGNEQRKQWMWEKIERCEKKMVRCRKGVIIGREREGAEEDRDRERRE